MSLAYPALAPPQRPPFDRPELHVHVHRAPAGISPAERSLVVVFLTRYAVWCAKARRFDRLRNAADLLAEVADSQASDRTCGPLQERFAAAAGQVRAARESP